MNENSQNFERIQKAIAYIQSHFKEQLSLEDIANHIGLSPTYFQKLFSDWAGVSPRKFMKYISLNYAKSLLHTEKMPLLDVAYDTGLSSPSRLHELFISIEGMSPNEYRNYGVGLEIYYNFYEALFGQVIITSTLKGICHIFFDDNREKAFTDLQTRFPKAKFINEEKIFHIEALSIFQKDWNNLPEVKLHLMGTEFQIKVWEALLKIPMGSLATYSEIAKNIGNPNASRAVGTAIGSNPIAFLIPCHRVIQTSGKFGGYMWGENRKTALIGWEMIQIYENR